MVRINRLYEVDSGKRDQMNKAGKAAQFGECASCTDSWSWKESHPTYIGSGMNVAPLCQECWEGMTPGQRLPFYLVIIGRWMDSRGLTVFIDCVRMDVIDAVLDGR